MILSLDTNVLVDLMRARKPYVRQYAEQALVAGDSIKVSTVVAHELILGAHLGNRTETHLDLIGRTLSQFSVEAWSWEDAVETGRLRAEMEDVGRRIGAYDTLIAGQALARDWILVTADVKDFSRIKGLHILDWSDPTGPIDVTGAMASWRRPSKD